MFALTTLVYPGVLAMLCVGAGLFVDRISGGWLPGPILPAVGAAALIALSQLCAYISPVAPATPYAMAVLAVAGFALRRERVRTLLRRAPSCGWQLVVPVIAYVLALAPVLLAGRATFSSYLALNDSVVHMIGADFLARHGQDFSHLDLRNSYGLFINAYYNGSYPSGADTLFGGSAFLLGLPLIWAFQPFNAFVLATAAGPAWLLLRLIGLQGGWAALGALCATVPALVYGYELVGSIKEIAALPMILTMGVLVVSHRRWLTGGAFGAAPFALVLAAGISALGAGFGAWVLAAAAILAAVLLGERIAGRQSVRRSLLLAGTGAIVGLICAWPTWVDLPGSVKVAQNIASTSNPGPLRTPLHTEQLLGSWLRGSFKQLPVRGHLTVTHLLIAVTLLACVLGAVHILRSRLYALGSWLAATLAVWVAFTVFATTWVNAKALMLTSPVVMLIAWGGVAALLRASAPRPALRPAPVLLALALAGGVLASDAMQYHGANLAPTVRFQEMSRLNARFAGRGPTLFTDFDEYSLYELRDLDVGGPNFIAAPSALAGTEARYRYPVVLDRLPPADLLAYPLIITRRDPTASRPPSAYRPIWRGTYYVVWSRRPGAPAAIADVGLSGPLAHQCAQIKRLAGRARIERAHLVAAGSPELVSVPLARTSHPARWGHQRQGLVMSTPGRLSAVVTAPRAGTWELWLKGQMMPAVKVALDGHAVASIGSQLGGNSLVPNTMTPLAVSLSAGRHRLSVTRGGSTLAPGDGGSAVLYGIFLTPATAAGQDLLHVVAPDRWRSLCGHSYEWVEAVRA
jgi:hypothetical protein